MLGFNIKAQTSLTEAVDFTSVGLNGEDIHLFDILDNGQYVLIEFFYSTSSGALTYVNKMIESYQYFGCNENDVYYMQISRYDDEAAARAWCSEYGIMFPTIHTESEGDTGDQICEMYGIPSYPTVILIAPDRQIVLQDIWPVTSTENIIDALTPFGIEEHECSEVLPEVKIEINKATSISIEAEFTPNFVPTLRVRHLCSYTRLRSGDNGQNTSFLTSSAVKKNRILLPSKAHSAETSCISSSCWAIFLRQAS